MTNGHPTRDEDFDLLALGAIEGEERKALEAHVASCGDCARKVAEARGRVAMLSLAAPPVAPSAAVKQRLMAQIRGEAAAAPAPAPAPASQPRGARAPDSDPAPAPAGFGRWWNAIFVPAAVALAALTIFLWHENRALDRRLAALHASMSQQQQQLDEARELAELMTSQSTITVPLAQQSGMPKGSAHVMYNAKMGMVMYDGEIAPAPAAKTYQLWLVPVKGEAISLGVFNGQSDHWMMKVPEGMPCKWFQVTLEPAGGMPRPTGPMVLMGMVS